MALLELAKDAQRLLAKQEAREKRRLLDFVPSNRQWDDGRLTATFRQPFDLLSETIAAAKIEDAASGLFAPNFEKWLPFVSEYRTLCLVPSPEFQRLVEDARGFLPSARSNLELDPCILERSVKAPRAVWRVDRGNGVGLRLRQVADLGPGPE